MPIVRFNGLNKRGVNVLKKAFRKYWLRMKNKDELQKEQSRKPRIKTVKTVCKKQSVEISF